MQYLIDITAPYSFFLSLSPNIEQKRKGNNFDKKKKFCLIKLKHKLLHKNMDAIVNLTFNI